MEVTVFLYNLSIEDTTECIGEELFIPELIYHYPFLHMACVMVYIKSLPFFNLFVITITVRFS